jgi:transcriptional regulator with XRE-family HTH domain
VKKQLRLTEEPDTELLALLEGIEDRPAKVHPKLQSSLKTTTPQEIQAEMDDEFVAQSISDLISHARQKRGLTLEQTGQILGVGKGRMSQIEKEGANLELHTLVRVARALNYDVRISFISKNPDRDIIESRSPQKRRSIQQSRRSLAKSNQP